ncbi:MAG: hypothetical protein MMC23_001821 [Stictis urceolatum]|nr:hypothetical protein [Stictis urceolata]
MPPPRMTANPVKPARYRPGKGPEEELSSSESEEEERDELEAPHPAQTRPAADSTKITSNLRNVDLSARRAQAAASEATRVEAEMAAQAAVEEGFETESSEEEELESDEGASSTEEESSSEDEAPKKLMRPTFVRKDRRRPSVKEQEGRKAEEESWAEQERRRKEKANELVQEQMEKNALARAAGKKNWDDDEDANEEDIDDRDGVDPEAEYAAWKLRELTRIKREREVIEVAEKEREEIERRRNLTAEEREAEDQPYLSKQKEEQESRGKMGYLQKYYHKGAFFQDDARDQGLDRRDLMGARFEDQTNREVLPEYMQIRDMTKLGKKGRTRYKDLKSEDTGRWADYGPKGRKRDMDLDDRFQPDVPGREREGPSGANATAVRERTRAPQGAPSGPRRDRDGDQSRDGGDSYRPDHDQDRWAPRSPSCSTSRPRTPPGRDRRRYSTSPSRRKRRPSPDSRQEYDKRRKVDTR